MAYQYQHTGKSVGPDRGRVMAYWVSGRREWRDFFHWKRQYRKQIGLLLLLVVALIAAATLLMRWVTGADWLTNFSIGISSGILYASLRFTIIAATIKAALVKTNDIIITSTGVSLNGKFNAFSGDSKKIKQINIIDEANPKILHICYHHLTHKGTTLNEIHVPIPKGRLGEAVKVMQLLEA